MRKNLLIFSSFFLTFIMTCIFTVYLYNYQQMKSVKGIMSVSLLKDTWEINGDKTFSTKSEMLDADLLAKEDSLLITYDLHGLCMLGDAASEIVLVDSLGGLHGVSLTKYSKNCFNGEQSATIPLRAFYGNDSNIRFTQLEVSFWYPTEYDIVINKIIAFNASSGVSDQSLLSPLAVNPSATPTIAQILPASPSATATPTAAVLINYHPTWAIQSVSSMKDSKDRVCSPRSKEFIEKWVDTAKDLGANYIAVETPYDNPSCGKSSVEYTKLWASIIHAKGLHVWHRHAFTSFEGTYSAVKDPNKNYLPMIADYIKANPDIFAPDDIFTPMPEPQNGGIKGVTYCPQNICIFNSAADFNKWLRDAMDLSQSAFRSIGMNGTIKIGYFGFDGFVAWGNNNPQWHGILEDATVAKMGNITIDHYPEAVGDTMKEDLAKLLKKYPRTPIIIGEWGTIGGGETVTQVINSMGAAANVKNIIGFNYWQMSAGGNESLINEDFTQKPTYATVQSFFKSTK